MCLGMFGNEGFSGVGLMGMFSKMTTMKVFEVVWEVLGFSGTVGFWSPSAISQFQKCLKLAAYCIFHVFYGF